MRGLTAAERNALLGWTYGSVDYDRKAIKSLEANGRVVTAPSREDPARMCWRRTDMAYLALRVCPVGEP